jgi:sigma-B regulation protein RsbU (phosphoserine phosphatase)
LDPLAYQLALKDRALASAVEGITISDMRLPDNPLVYVNPGFTEITGYSREESIGRNCRYLQGPDTDPDAIAEIRNAIAERRSCVMELLNYRKDDTSFWNRLSLTPLRDESGEVTHYVGIQTDITSRREAEDALQDANERLERVNQRMQVDLEAAAAIQRSMLPEQLPSIEGVSCAWHLTPCDELAGDTLDLIQLDDDHLGMYVLDVSGHGVPAALLSVALHHWLSPDPDRSVLRSIGPRTEVVIESPSAVAKELNTQFPMDPRTSQYFTVIYGILSVSRRQFRYVTAGHPAPIHVPASAPTYQTKSAGTPIGFFPQTQYETRTLDLDLGDRIYLFSDGLPELENEAGEMFGQERLVAAIESYRSEELEQSVKSVVGETRRWSGRGTLGDDLTLLGIQVS